MRLFDPLKRNATRFGDRIFLYSESGSISYEQAGMITDKISGGLLSLGVKREDRVVIFSPNSINYVLAMYGIFKAGAIASLIDVLDAEKLPHYVKEMGPRVLIFSFEVSEAVETERSEMPSVRHYICFESGVDYAVDWDVFISSSQASMDEKLRDEEPCHFAYTSGTTYQPKPTVLSHEPAARATSCIAERLGITYEDTTLGITTLSSSHILVYGLLPQVHRGAKTGVMEKWDPRKAWDIIRKMMSK